MPANELVNECSNCKKKITDNEYIVNWGYCSECLDNHLHEHKKQKEK
jgi:hypothetical protein